MPNDTNVLIVGGAGYIGSHTTLALAEAGYGTIVYDDFSSGHRGRVFRRSSGGRTPRRDRETHRDPAQVRHRVRRPFRGADRGRGNPSSPPLPFFENNVAGTLSLLTAMNAADVGRIVFSSTAAAYGNTTGRALLSEDLPRAPINPYGESKVMVEKILEACVGAHGLQAIAPAVLQRVGGRTAKAARANGTIPKTHLIPLVIEAGARQAARDQDLRHRLRHAGRNLHPRLHPCLGRSRPAMSRRSPA